MKRIFLIDCPGIVPPSSKDTETDILFRGVVRVEHVSNPEQFIPAMLERCKRHHLENTYEVKGWEDATQFLEMIARKSGRLLKGGEPDESGVAKMVLNDFNRGKIPWFVPPPEDANRKNATEEEEVDDDESTKKAPGSLKDRTGKLGEMRKKRPTKEEIEEEDDIISNDEDESD